MPVNDALGVGGTFTWKEKVYQLSPADNLKVQAQYTQHLKQTAANEIESLRPLLHSHQIECLYTAFSRDLAARFYEFPSTAWRESFKTRSNRERLAFIMLQEHHKKEITLQMVGEMFSEIEDEIMRAVWGDVLPNDETRATTPASST